jgi:hypothetical protein
MLSTFRDVVTTRTALTHIFITVGSWMQSAFFCDVFCERKGLVIGLSLVQVFVLAIQQRLSEVAGWQNVVGRLGLRHTFAARSKSPALERYHVKYPWK